MRWPRPDIEAIRARAEAATPGPWETWDDGFYGYIQTMVPGLNEWERKVVGGEPSEGRIASDDPNAEFIAHARQDIPDLLDYAEALRATLLALRRGDCWCEIGIGHPSVRYHSAACGQARALVGEAE